MLRREDRPGNLYPGPVSNLEDLARDSRSGADEIALRAAEALAALPASDLPRAVEALVRGHPSMAPLWRLGSDVLGAEDHAEGARAFAEHLVRERERLPEVAAKAVGTAEAIVVHSWSSSVILAAAALKIPVLCGRSEPGGEGQATAGRLRELGVGAKVVDDRDALAAARDHPVLVGADAVGPGGVINKVGTAALARGAGDGCHVVTLTTKLVAVDLPVVEPFERVPLDAFTSIVTEEGPHDAGGIDPTRFPLHPKLARFLATLR